MIPMRAITTLISSRPLTALMRKSKTEPISRPRALPSVTVMSGRREVCSSMASLVSVCSPAAASMNATVGAVSPTSSSKVPGLTRLPTWDESWRA